MSFGLMKNPTEKTVVFLCLVSSWTLFLPGTRVATGQDVTQVVAGPGPTCDSCRIVIETIAEVGDETGPGQIYERATIKSDRQGRYVVSARNRGVVQLFAPTGEFLQTVGESGQGPGEYQSPLAVPSATDKLLVFDSRQGRVTHLSGEFEVVATNSFVLRDFADIIQLPNGALVAAATIRDPARFGQPLHLLAADGSSIARSFGGSGRAIGRREGITLQRVLSAPAEDGSFWSLRGTRYRLEEWSSDGQLLTTIERDVDWFAPWTEPPGTIAREAPPPPISIGIDKDVNGYLWTLVNVADEGWRPLPPGRVTAGGGVATTMSQRNRLHDTMIEVIDPDSGALLASARVDEYLRGFADRGVVYSYFEDELGKHPRYLLRKLELVLE